MKLAEKIAQNIKFSFYEILLEDENEKFFIQSIQLLKLILNDFVTSDIDHFPASLNKLSDDKLKDLESKIKNNNQIKETV